MVAARKQGERKHFAMPIDKRWIGEDGYRGLKRERTEP